MSNWFERHFMLTREEKLLIGGILLIVLCGLGVKYAGTLRSASLDPVQTEVSTLK